MNLRVLLLMGAALAQGQAPEGKASAGVLGEHELQAIEKFAPQQQAERLLERAVSRYGGALEEIEKRLPGWEGKLKYSKQLETLINLGLNSSQLGVRTAAVDLTLAANRVGKEHSDVVRFMESVKPGGTDRAWGFWVLGMLAGRGVETEEIRRFLMEYLQEPDEQARQWVVNSLAMVGGEEIIEPLLEVFGRDASMVVRERAGCGLAEGGLMTREQRRKAIPGLIRLMDDASLNEETRAWVFQALEEISGQRLPRERGAWRNWHARQR